MDKNDVIIGITADATGVEAGVAKSKRSLASLGASAKKASQDLGGAGDGGEKAAAKVARDTRTMQQSLQRYIATLEAGSKDNRVYWERMASFKGVDKNALRPLLDQLDELKRKQQEAAGASGSLVASLKGLYAAAAVAVSGFAVQGLITTTKTLYDASAAAERLRIGLDFASSRGSVNEIAYLRDVTHRLGLEFYGTAQAYQQFQAAARGTAMEGQQARAVFESIAKASAVMGLSTDNVNGVLLALQQMISKGNVQAEELRGQLGERLPGAFQIAARAMGATTSELSKMLENGQVLADDFLPKFAAELERSLGDAPEKAANRLDASVNRAISAWTRFKENVGDSGVSQFWAGQMDILSDGLSNFNQRVEQARVAGDGFGGQLLAGAAAALEFVNPINAISYSALEAGNKLKDAEKRLQELKDAGAHSSSNLMLRESYAHAQRLVDKLREAKAAQDSLAGINPANAAQPLRDIETGNTRGNRDGYYKDLFGSQQFLAQRNDGITKQFAADIEGLASAYAKGALSATEYSKAVTEANKRRHESTEAGKAEAKAAAEAAKGNKSAESAIQSFIKSLEAKTAAQRLEIAQGEKLTESQRARIQLESLLANSKNKATAGQIAYARAQLQEAEANELWLQNQSDVAKALADMQKAREASLRSVQDSVRKLLDEAEASAYAEAANITLAEAVERLALARAENAYQQAVERGESQQTLDYLRQEIDARKQLVTATAQKGVKEANKKAAEQAAKDWERVSQTIGDTLADYIMSGGQDAATYLKRLFSTLVLQPVVQTVVGGVLGTGEASASGVASGGVGGIANLAQQAYGAFTSPVFSNFGMGMASNIQQLGGTLFGKGFESLGSGIVDFGNTVAQFSDAINIAGDVFGYGSALYSLSKGNYGSALGSAVGTYFGGPVGAMLGSTLGGLLDGALGGFSSRGANHVGGTYSSQGLNDRQVAIALGLPVGGNKAGDLYKRSNAALDQSLAGLAGGLLGVYNGLIEQTGGNKLGINAGFAINPKYDDEESYGYFRIIDEVTGKVLVKYDNRDLSSNHDKAWQQYSSAMAGAFVGQLKQADIPGWMRDVLDGLGGAITTEGFAQAAQQIALMDSAFKSWAVNVDGFDDLAASVQTTLVRTAGGFDALAASVEGYYQNFYTEQERAEKSAAQMSEVLAEYGVELPATTEQYRALVEQQLAAGDAGAELAAVLLGMQGSFKSAADVWQKELAVLASSVGSFFGDLQSAVDSLSADVAADRKTILRGSDVMSAADIAAGIAGALVAAPSLSGVDGAAAASLAAGAAAADAQSAHDAAQEVLAKAQQKRDAATAERDAVASQIAAAQGRIAYHQWDSSRIWGDGEESGHSLSKRKRWQRDIDAAIAKEQALIASLQPKLDPLNQAAGEQQDAYDALAETAQAAAQRLAEAQKALADAQKAQEQARVDYAKEMSQFVADAAGSVDKLSDLRGEVVNFYEAQAQAVQAMLQSAGNLRGVVDQLRLGQLNTAQTAAELGSRYATDYAMALATTGSTRAGYVDAMASNLAGLSEALKAEAATGEDWRIETAKLFAQASNAAGLLEGDAESDDYQDVALGLLDSIDAALANLSGVTQSAEDLLVKAIKEGSASNLDGLRAIVAALQGEAIPAFAAGGLHAGGLRLVGERGPELEVTGPARYWSAGQTAALMGGGSNDAVVRELRELREEQRAQASKIVQLQQENNRLLMRWETQGLPEKREVIA